MVVVDSVTAFELASISDPNDLPALRFESFAHLRFAP